MDDVNFTIPAGAIVGIIGPNGAGKSTLFRMIAGKEKPDAGEIEIGPTRQARRRRSDAANRSTARRRSSTTSAAASIS